MVSIVCAAAPAQPTVSLVPVGNHPGGGLDRGSVIIGNEIKLASGGRRVFFEVRVSDWDPDDTGVQLQAFQATVEGYGSFQRHATTSCSEDADCTALIGNGSRCNQFQNACTIADPFCDLCQGAFIDESRSDFVFADSGVIKCAVDLATPETRVACTHIFGTAASPNPFPENGLYLGTVILDVPRDARGSFSVNLEPFADTQLVDQDSQSIPADFAPAIVTVEHPPTNRYLAVTASSNANRAIRVTYDDLPTPFATLNGRSMWVGQPYEISESADDLQTGIPRYEDFFVAPLQCEPLFTNWAEFGLIQVFDGNIIPNAGYTIEFFDEGEPPTLAADVEPLVVQTSRWGDLVGVLDEGYWTAPDGGVNVPTDIIAMIETFSANPRSPHKVRVDLDPAVPDGLVYIIDILRGIRAFQGVPYPFEPQPFPCE